MVEKRAANRGARIFASYIRWVASLGIVAAILLFSIPCQAKNYGFTPTIEPGLIWKFGFKTKYRDAQSNVAPMYGGSLILLLAPYVQTQWARNIGFEVSYVYSMNHVKVTTLQNKSIFRRDYDQDWDWYENTVLGHFSYFFPGRTLHPNMTAAVGVTVAQFDRTDIQDKPILEIEPTLQFGGGLDVTVYKPSSGIALEDIRLGVRTRYTYYIYQVIVDEALNAVDVGLRLGVTF